MTTRESVGGILWDFDGTLAFRPGEWRGTVMEVLNEHDPGHGIDVEQVRPFLRSGFPWHTPDEPHPDLNTAEEWWRSVCAVIALGFEANGYSPARSAALARLVRERYVDGRRGWRLVDGARQTLHRLTRLGWRHAILSNHVPELPEIVEELGLGDDFEAVLSSAAIGYEKPHPESFALGRAALGNPANIWMVGDNPAADVAGAQACGMQAVLVQHPDRPSTPEAVPLKHVPDRVS